MYLAKLHALTGHVVPDPLTGRPGSSAALSLLRSGRCAGNVRETIDEQCESPETMAVLEVAALAPQRNWYPPEMQKMEMIDDVLVLLKVLFGYGRLGETRLATGTLNFIPRMCILRYVFLPKCEPFTLVKRKLLTILTI